MDTTKSVTNSQTDNRQSSPELHQISPRGKDYSISCIRFIAFCFIVSCHMLQYFDNVLAWWLNVGVQIFLFISGYLYGGKYAGKSIKCLDFYKKRLLKIIVPYYIVMIPAVLLHVFLLGEHLSVFDYLKLILCIDYLKGGEHLWFIIVILVNYLLTPLYVLLFNKIKKKFFIPLVLIIAVGLFIVFILPRKICNPAWMICYFLGFAYGFNEKKRFFSMKAIHIMIFILALQNIAQIVNQYFYTVIKTEGRIYSLWSDLNHVWLGISLFILLRFLFTKLRPERSAFLRKVLDISDQYSYEGYLVHQFIILGPLSLMALTNSLFVNILIVLCSIVILSFCVKQIENLIFGIFKRKRKT